MSLPSASFPPAVRSGPASAEDTIVAVATPLGRGGLGVVRLSGPQARTIADQVLRPVPWEARRVRRVLWCDPEDGAVLDDVLVTFFPAPHSYTAEDVVEISGHGAPVLLRALVADLCRAGARMAEPGEFTRRAFLNGRLDLTQAEAIRDLIDSQTLLQARTAAQQMHGGVARQVGPLQQALRELIARMEAGIDFADDDVAVPATAGLAAALHALVQRLDPLRTSFRHGRVLHQGLSLALVGRPNVGKSSLFNRLLASERAIVTATAGTTRDVLAETVSLDGVPIRLLDTAGIRESSEAIEREGIARAWQALGEADLVLGVFDASLPLAPEDHRLLEHLRAMPQAMLVLNKTDLPRQIEDGALPEALAVSAVSGEGVTELRTLVRQRALPELSAAGSWITNARQAACLDAASQHLEQGGGALAAGLPHEMVLLDLYAALRELDALSGQTTVDDILEVIFATFCVGK